MPSPFTTSDSPIMAIDAVTFVSDATVPANTRYLRVKTAGNLIVRAPGSAADATIPANDGEYVPVGPGTIVRSTSTVGSLVAFGL